MDKLINYIIKNLTGKEDNTYLKLVSVVYDKPNDVVVFKFIYQDLEMTKSMKQRVIDLIAKYYENRFNVDCKMKRAFLDEDAIQEFVYRLILENCKSILNFYKYDIKVVIGDVVAIDCNVAEQFYEFFENRNFAKTIIDNLNNNFFGDFQVNFHPVAAIKTNDVLKEKEKEIEKMIEISSGAMIQKTMEVELGEKLVGNAIESNVAIEISGIKKPQENVMIAGKINYFLKKSFVSKGGAEKEYFSFNIQDYSGKMACVCFPRKDEFEAVSQLQDGVEVIALGNVEEFNNRINFKLKSMAFCKLPEKKEEIVSEKGVNDDYIYIKPEPYVNVAQDNFLMERKEPNEFLKQNDIVVFDLETTGLEYSKNEIIEIGAVKMRNGEIIEQFTCFVKPTVSIPEEIVQLTHITDDMVKDAYTIDKVIPDFYKFCYGCVIMAYNIDFDYKFLNFQATKLGYKFNNRQVDAMYLARLNVVGAKNFKLGSICAKLGISLEGAHRAINDVVATAEVIKLISDNVSPK